MCSAVGNEQRTRGGGVKSGKLGKLVNRQLVGKAMTARNLNRCQTEHGRNVLLRRYCVEHLRLGLIVAGGDDDSHHIAVTEGVLYLLVRYLSVGELYGHCVGVVIREGTVK